MFLLRATLGVTVLVQGAVYLSEKSELTFWTLFAVIAAIIGGVFILLGFLTPITCVLLFAGGIISAFFTSTDFVQILIYETVLSVAVALLGPGAFSLDARIFGRREIIIPKN